MIIGYAIYLEGPLQVSLNRRKRAFSEKPHTVLKPAE